MDDRELARRIGGGGDAVAETELFNRFARRIRLYGLRHVRDEQAAQDLVQQVLVVVIESLRQERVREPERLSSFVLGTCRMVVRDLRRGECRRQGLLERYGGHAESQQEPAAALDIEHLRECLEKLPPRERTVVILTFYGERSGEEIATELGMTPGNVRLVRHRAVAHLQQCLGVDDREVPA